MENKLTLALIGGARPNFMKIAPLYHELKRKNIDFFLVNTGQHFDQAMAGQFFDEFKIKADITLTPKRDESQFEDIKQSLKKIFEDRKPDIVVVFGDVNSTLAGAEAAKECGIKLVHVEAGLRSYNPKMQEEQNRIKVDRLSDILFATEEEGVLNLKKEGIENNVLFVGNIMMDTLSLFASSIKETDEKFYFATMHRAENVDNESVFSGILNAFEIISKDQLIYLPLHPRTKARAESFGLMSRIENMFKILPPLSYEETLFYEKNALLVITDSGGIQEETSFLGTPCMTIREDTERPITITKGTNVIAGVSTEEILETYKNLLEKGLTKKKTEIPLWDGKTAERIVEFIQKL